MFLAPLLILVTAQDDPAFKLDANPLIFRHPTASRTSVVFGFAGDLWSVPRSGGAAKRLTSAIGQEWDPFFSPDGKQIAFTAQYDGNVDAYVMPAEGGVPRRLTSHPGNDLVQGWSPDGKNVLVQSAMLSNNDYVRMFQVPATGGVPKALPVPAAVEGAISPEGTHLAYVASPKWQAGWKRYKGGQAGSIWIARLSDSKWVSVPKKNTDDHNPVWMGDSIYYLTDPNGKVGLNRYEVKTGQVTEEIRGDGFDIKSITAGPDVIAYAKLGSVYLYNPGTRVSSRVPITVKGDFPEVRPALKDVSSSITGVSLSPGGNRVVAAARGWIFTLPAAKGDARLLDGTQGVHRRDPAWSPDAKTIAYISDQDGTQKLALYDVTTSKEKRVELAESPGYYANPKWSPDGKRILYTSEKLGLYCYEVASGKSIKLDKQTYRGRGEMVPSWSPDSKWVAYSRDLDNNLNAVFLYSFATGKATQITDGLSDAVSPVFDLDGKHLYFLASTDIGASASFEDISGYAVPNSTYSIYAAVLRKDLENPLQPESDEEVIKSDEKKADDKKAEDKKAEDKKPAFNIDLDAIEDRIIALPLPRRVYRALGTGTAGTLFVLAGQPRQTFIDPPGPGSLLKFTLKDRKTTPVASGVGAFQTNYDGTKMLIQGQAGLQIASTAGPVSPSEGLVNTDDMRVKIDPRTEWTSIYHDACRSFRLLFYDANTHGVDTVALEKRYEPFVAGLVSRDDLNYLLTDLRGEVCVGHLFISGGDMPRPSRIGGGLLGADYSFENGRYRLARIYNGERWNPGLYAPLAQPGVNAKVGEYILAIDGQELTDAKDIYLLLEGKAGKQVKVKLGPTPDGKGSREATVVPIGSEQDLRFRAWSEDNRKTVDRLTGGRIGYLHVPDTNLGGWREFQRYYYAQHAKSGMIVDDRFNHGGAINDYMVYEMEKPLDFIDIARYGKELRDPASAVYGPKVMIANEMAGSGGDIFPYLFKKHKTGKLVGRRTWGAMISSFRFTVVDGGSMTAPDDAMADPETGDWIIENYGTPPDIEVELDPYLWRLGRDAQLEAAVDQILKDLAKYKPANISRPKYPNWSKLRDKN